MVLLSPSIHPSIVTTLRTNPHFACSLARSRPHQQTGHVNHSLFWENLAPAGSDRTGAPQGELADLINASFGSFEDFKTKFNAQTAAVQGAFVVDDDDSVCGACGVCFYFCWLYIVRLLA